MSSNLNSMCDYWKSFGLEELQKELDRDATEIASRQDESESSRKKLVEQSREFKKSSTDDVRKLVAPLLKSFQFEIDALTKRSKNSETAFLNIYKTISDLPDPTPALEYGLQLQKKASKLQELEIVNRQLKERLDEYNNEFAEVKNQEVTVKQLKEKLKEYEEKMELTAQIKANEKEKEIQRQFGERERHMIERQTELAKKLGEAEHRSNTLQAALNSIQSDLFDMKTRHDEALTAKADEVELLVADLERANERAISAERVLEQLQQDISDFKVTSGNEGATSSFLHDLHPNENVEHAIDILKRSSLEVELAAKEKEVSQLVDDVQRLQLLVNKQRDTSSSQLARLEEELANRSKHCSQLEQKLNAQSDYEEIKRELCVLKSLEFSCLDQSQSGSQEASQSTSSESKSLETLLLEKNRILQSENTTLKCSNADVRGKYHKLQEQYNESVTTIQEQKQLIVQLEEDLRSVNALSVMFRGDAEGEAVTSTNQNAEFVASLVNERSSLMHPEAMKSATDGLLPIIQNQRERFRVRAQELESVTIAQQQQVQHLQNEMDKLRSDNLKLYEKIKFLQGYSKSKNQPHSLAMDETESRYSSQYDQRLDPFNSFNQKEKLRRYMDLKPYDKITLGMGRFIMSSRKARTIVFFYTLFLHVFVFLVLYKLAYTASCQRDTAAEDWHKKFADHMAMHHTDGQP